MKQSIARWSATLGLVGSTLIGGLCGGSLPALALTEQEVFTQLQPIPVFTVTDNEGAPLVAAEAGKPSFAGAFISQKDALAFIEELKRSNPEIGSKVQVVPISLGEIYQINHKAGQSGNDNVRFAYVPAQAQVDQALATIKQDNPQASEFKGVPLFVARGTGEQQGFLTIDIEGKPMIPFFFDKEQLQERIQNMNVKIEVVPLEGVIQAMNNGNDEFLKNILLVPSRESVAFLETLRQNSPQNGAQNSPQNNPQNGAQNAPRR